jgi:hypothetical protein
MPYGTVNADVIGTSIAGSNIGAGNASIMKNRIINGAMVIDQRNAGASLSAINGNYGLDRWAANSYNGIATTGIFTVQQNAGSVTPPIGFANYLGVTSSAATSFGSTGIYTIWQAIEGYNIADLAWGTASAKTVTLSFQVYSSLTGTFGGSVQNGGGTRSYPFTYTVSSANTWTTINITIVGDTTTPSTNWFTTNGVGMYVRFGLGVGSTYSGTAGSWASANYYSATGATSVVGTNGATFYITGVQLEVGSSATGFEYVNYQTSLANCQRYCIVYGRDQVYNELGGTGFAYSGTTANIPVSFPVQMRTTPTLTVSGNFQLSDGAAGYAGSGISIVTGQSSTFIASVGVTSSGLTVYRAYRLESTNSTASYALFSSEL